MRRKQVERACADLAREMKGKSEGLNEAESKFFELAILRGKRTYRHGWPDFLVEDPVGGWLGVEIKTGRDTIRENPVRPDGRSRT